MKIRFGVGAGAVLGGWGLKRRLRDVLARLEPRSTLQCPMVQFFVNGIPNYTHTVFSPKS